MKAPRLRKVTLSFTQAEYEVLKRAGDIRGGLPVYGYIRFVVLTSVGMVVRRRPIVTRDAPKVPRKRTEVRPLDEPCYCKHPWKSHLLTGCSECRCYFWRKGVQLRWDTRCSECGHWAHKHSGRLEKCSTRRCKCERYSVSK